MTVNQTELYDGLEQIAIRADKENYIYEFLSLFGTPNSTITRMRNPESDYNAAAHPEQGEVAQRARVYFKPVVDGQDIFDAMGVLRASPRIASNSIRFLIVTDFNELVAYDTRTDETMECAFLEQHKELSFFLPLVGYERSRDWAENEVDVRAAEKMGRLFDLIRANNTIETAEQAHHLNVFLTRLLFCFFAEDTDIFAKGQFTRAISENTLRDGSDTGEFFDVLFDILNAADNSAIRKKVPNYLSAFPYVNGGLFKDKIQIPKFTARIRRNLLDSARLNWSEINPDIFGSMFQAVIDPEQRSNQGQHYTSVPNIMKVIQPLFLQPLYEELNRIISLKDASKKVKALHQLSIRLGEIKIFDPACGSGNFLIIAYKELRLLEMEIFKAIQALAKEDTFLLSTISLDQFYGIEMDDSAQEIATLSLWLAEHQMNVKFKELFGSVQPTLPLKASGHIVHGNSLRVDWNEVCPKTEQDEVYVVGNPPFGGAGNRTTTQTEDMELVFDGFPKFKYLDYVACWFWKGAQYIQDTQTKLALVSTNSLCQGEQVAMLWPYVFDLNVQIDFAYQTFPWRNNARDNAAVHVVIIGLANSTSTTKTIYRLLDNQWHSQEVKNISPYLIEGGNLTISSRETPLGAVSRFVRGNQPTDGGNLLMTTIEKDNLIREEPNAAKWIKKLLGSDEFINGKERWCLWLVGISAEELLTMPKVMERVNAVKEMRLSSRDRGANRLAERPHQFRDLNNPEKFILIPRVSTSRRNYIPMGYFQTDSIITTDLNNLIINGSLYEFGIVNSTMHNDWMRTVAGRLGVGYRYSGTLVYNTFPWPEATEKQKQEIAELAEEVILVREEFPAMTLAQLYNPESMPDRLLAAHQALDRAVEQLYRKKPFADAFERVEFLFGLYEQLIEAERNQQAARPSTRRASKTANRSA
ncbi:MAG: N-6 DNA methylase [Alcaligenaceae bacterium]|nr:N-6 DNA methylase [Alcaligenaceae bacterium]